MKDQSMMVFGDSYSTFAGCVPTGYAVYYTGSRTMGPDIKGAHEAWWGMLAAETGARLVRNDSWSGSTIGFTGYNNADTSGTSSFIYRLEKLAKEGFFEENKIENVFVFGGTNDSWSNAPLGEEMRDGWQREDLFCVLPAIGYFFARLREILPHAHIYGICNCNIKEEIVTAIQNACAAIHGKAIVLKQIEKSEGHPTPLGMVQIKDEILAALG